MTDAFYIITWGFMLATWALHVGRWYRIRKMNHKFEDNIDGFTIWVEPYDRNGNKYQDVGLTLYMVSYPEALGGKPDNSLPLPVLVPDALRRRIRDEGKAL